MMVFDAGAFIEGVAVEGITSSSVARETNVPANIRIFEPKQEFVEKVRKTAEKTGDLDVLSQADIDVLAIALEIGGTVATNDFAVQNVASSMGINWEGTSKKITKMRIWEWYCPACWKRHERKGVCHVCGTELKRRPKQEKSL